MGHVLTISGVIRQLSVKERDLFAAHLLRLSAVNRHERFHGGISDAAVEAYAHHVFTQNTHVFGFFIEGKLRGAVELAMTDPLGASADLAFTVEEEFQNGGIGGALLGRAILVAKKCGIENLHFDYAAHNIAMQHLAQRYHARLSTQYDEVEADFSPFAA